MGGALWAKISEFMTSKATKTEPNIPLWTCGLVHLHPGQRRTSHHHCSMFKQTVINLQKCYPDCCIFTWSAQGDLKETPNNLIGAKTGNKLSVPSENSIQQCSCQLIRRINLICFVYSSTGTSCSYQGDNIYVFHQSSRSNVLSILGPVSMNFYIKVIVTIYNTYSKQENCS